MGAVWSCGRCGILVSLGDEHLCQVGWTGSNILTTDDVLRGEIKSITKSRDEWKAESLRLYGAHDEEHLKVRALRAAMSGAIEALSFVEGRSHVYITMDEFRACCAALVASREIIGRKP